MENNTPSSYPDSNASTPRSRDHPHHQDDNNNNNNYKVKLMCSYGGKILPRPHDHLLTYIGGDTKILSVDRHVTFLHLLHKLHLISSPSSSSICFKYQLPGEDLDALISVTNDEDLEHMMSEYDRIHKASVKPVRLRLFLFAFNSDVTNTILTSADDDKQQWFVDALNAVQISGSEASPASENTPDYLFGFDKAVKPQPGPGSECGSEDSNSNSNSNSNNVNNNNNNRVVEMQNHQQQQQMQVNMDPRAYYGDYYTKIQAAGPGQPQPRYWQDQQRHMTTGGYPMSVAGTDSPVYLVPASAGVYPSAPVAAAAPPVQAQAPAVMTMRPAAAPQAYYGMQRLVNNTSEQFYREQQAVYGTMTQPQIQQPVVRPQAELGYGHVGQLGPVGVDATGRQVYYTTSQGGMGPTTYQPVVASVAAADMRQGPGLTVNQEGKMVVNPNKIP